MAWSGGTFSRVHDWTTDAGSAINIEASRMDAEDDNFATGINTCLTKDGQNSPTANLPMGGQRHTGVGNAAALTDYASAADVIDNHLTYYVTTGSSNAYVLTPSPSIGAYAEGQILYFRANHTNTGASTLNVNSLGAIAIQTPDGSALAGDEIELGGYYGVIYDANSTPDRWVLVSPPSNAPLSGSANTWTADQTIQKGAPSLYWDESDATTNERLWRVIANTAAWKLQTRTDADSVGAEPVVIGRTGTTVDSIDLTATSVMANSVEVLTEDISGLTSIAINDVASTDGFLVDDAGTAKHMAYSAAGCRYKAPTGTTDTIDSTDLQCYIAYQNATSITVTLNSGVGAIGNWILMENAGGGTFSLAGTATINSAVGSAPRATNSVIALFCTASGVWTMFGDGA